MTGCLFSGTNLEEFAASVQRTLLDLGEDPSLALAQIHEATAKSLIERGHHDLVQTVKKVPREPGQYASGARAAFLKWWRESPVYGLIHGKASRGEAVFVDQAEGDRRAAICVNCPHNVIPAGKGWLQNWSDGQMLKSVEGRTTASQDRLGVFLRNLLIKKGSQLSDSNRRPADYKAQVSVLRSLFGALCGP